MKKKSLKALAVFGALTMVLAGLSGCTKPGNEIVSEYDSPVVEVVEVPSTSWEKPSAAPVEEGGDNAAIEAALKKFAEENASVKVVTERTRGLSVGQSYTLDEMVEAMNASLAEDFIDAGMSVHDASYAFVDCGKDGISELALWLSANTETQTDELNDYYIIRENNGSLELVDCYESYYRSFGSLNKYGIFCSNGSAGASSGSIAYYRVNANGEHEIIYGTSYEFGLAEPVILGHLLPSDIELPAGYPVYSEDYGNVECDAYFFEESSKIAPDDEAGYAEFLRNLVYVFRQNNEVIAPDQKYADFYSENGIMVTDEEGLDELIAERLSDLGLTKEDLTAPEEDFSMEPAWVMVRDFIHTENQGG